MRARTVVVVGLISRGGRLLISQRGEPSGYAGYWEFPGGKREAGERDRDALRRELREELAIDVEVGPLVWTTSTGGFHLRFIACRYPGGSRPRPIVSTQFRWVRLEDLANYTFPPADDSIIAALISGRVRPFLDGDGRLSI